MLDLSADNLRQEVEAAVDVRKRVTDASRPARRRFVGNHHRSDWKAAEEVHENLEFEFVVNLVPNLVYQNPHVDVDSAIVGQDHPSVHAMQFGLNGWIQRSYLARVLTEIAFDCCFDFGVAGVSVSPTPGYDTASASPPLWPAVWRIDPERFFTDPRAPFLQGRFRGHIWIRDRDDLLQAVGPDGAPVYDAEMVRLLTEDTGRDDLRGIYADDSDKAGPHRKSVIGYEVFVPETGMIYTLGYTATSTGDGRHGFLREPRQYQGPGCGPYTMFGLYPVRGQPYPLSPLAVASGLIEEINAHAGQVSDDAAAAKRLVLVNSSNPELIKAITTEENNTVVGVPAFNGEHAQVDFGGPQKANLEFLAMLRERLDRRTGQTETVRGNLTGATATEVNEAATAGDVRTKFARTRFRECVVDVLKIAAWHMHENPEIEFPVSWTDPMTGARQAGTFRGGPQPDPVTGQMGEHTPFESLGIEISPYSMEMVDDAVLQRRMQAATEITTKVAPLMLQMPFLRRPLIDDLFETLNIKGASDRYIDWQVLEQMRGMAAMGLMGMPGAGQPGAPGQPGMGGPPGGMAGPGGGVGGGGPMGQQPQMDEGLAEYAGLLAEAGAA